MIVYLALLYVVILALTMYMSMLYESQRSMYLKQGVNALNLVKEGVLSSKLNSSADEYYNNGLLNEYIERSFLHVAENLIYSHNNSVISKSEFDPIFKDSIKDGVGICFSSRVKKDYPIVSEYIDRHS